MFYHLGIQGLPPLLIKSRGAALPRDNSFRLSLFLNSVFRVAGITAAPALGDGG
jgi:hypothetical protein